jgi:hypothetical protein
LVKLCVCLMMLVFMTLLSWFCVLIVDVLRVSYIQWHQLSSWVLLLYLSRPWFSFRSTKPNGRRQKMKVWKAIPSSTTEIYKACVDIDTWKMLKKRMIYFFCYPILFSSLPQFDYNNNNKEKMDMISICSSIYLSSFSSDLDFWPPIKWKKATKTRQW